MEKLLGHTVWAHPRWRPVGRGVAVPIRVADVLIRFRIIDSYIDWSD